MKNSDTPKKTLIKLFIFLFVSQVFFIHWIGWGENTRFDLTRAISEEGSFSINSYRNNTSDRVYFKGNYYSDKPPLISMISAPIHSLIVSLFPFEKIENNVLLKRKVGLTFIEEELFLPLPIKLSMIFSTILVSLLPNILTSLLIFRLSFKILNDIKKSLMIALIYSFGTLAFPSSLIYFGNSLLTFFVFSSFLIIFIKKGDLKTLFVSGLLLGISSLIDYLAFLFLPAFLFYVALKTKNFKIFVFIFSVLLGLMPLLLYQYLIFNNPFEGTYKHTDQQIWTKVHLNLNYGIESILPSLSKIYRITIDSYRGIFFYYPILFIFLFGILKIRKIWKEETIFVFILFFTFLYFFSISWNWWGGASFSIRYFSPIMPFLTFGMISLAKLKFYDRINKISFFIIAFSIFVNILSLQGVENKIEDPINIYPQNVEKVNSFGFIDAPLFTKYLSEFLFKGPTPKLFNSIFYNSYSFLDIRDNVEQPVGDLLFNKLYLFDNFFLRTGVFLLTINIILFIFLFRSFLNKKLIKISIVFIILFFTLSIGRDTVFYVNCYREENPGFRWCKDDSLIYLYSNNSTKYKLYIYLFPANDTDFLIKINNKSFIFKTEKDKPEVFSQIVELKKGKNSIEIFSNRECKQLNEFFFKEGNSTDTRCVSFALFNEPNTIPLNELFEKDLNILHTSGWYTEEKYDWLIFRWMRNKGKIEIYSPKSKLIMLLFYARNFEPLNETELKIFNDEYLIFKENITKDWKIYSTNPFLVKNYTIIDFDIGQCLYPHELNISSDSRCLGLAIGNLTVIDFTEFLKLVPKKGLYQKEFDISTNITFNWYQRDAEFLIYSINKMGVKIKFLARGIVKMDAKVKCNELEKIFNIDEKWGNFEFECFLREGENSLIFETPNCYTPNKLNISNDNRCLSVAIGNLTIDIQ
jgi:hypothetical protein